MYDEEYNSDSSAENARCPVLPVGALPSDFDPNRPPATAEEYLHQVMYEAKRCKNVVTVELDKSKIKKQNALVRTNLKAPAPAGYAPTADEQQEIVNQFLSTKNEIERMRNRPNRPKPPVKMPTDENPEHWCKFCFGNSFQRSLLLKQQQSRSDGSSSSSQTAASTSSVIPDEIQGNEPLLSVLLNIRQVTLQNLVEWHVGWLQVTGFSKHQGKWLYSLLSCLEKPLTPELCDNIRQMVYLCASARAALDAPSHPFLAQLNLIITIVTRYFGQEDLADPR